jgi:hypothetical protein
MSPHRADTLPAVVNLTIVADARSVGLVQRVRSSNPAANWRPFNHESRYRRPAAALCWPSKLVYTDMARRLKKMEIIT